MVMLSVDIFLLFWKTVQLNIGVKTWIYLNTVSNILIPNEVNCSALFLCRTYLFNIKKLFLNNLKILSFLHEGIAKNLT